MKYRLQIANLAYGVLCIPVCTCTGLRLYTSYGIYSAILRLQGQDFWQGSQDGSKWACACVTA